MWRLLLMILLPVPALAEDQGRLAETVAEIGSTRQGGWFGRSPFTSAVEIDRCEALLTRRDAGRGDALIEAVQIDLRAVDFAAARVELTRGVQSVILPLRTGAMAEETRVDTSARAALSNKALGDLTYVTAPVEVARYRLMPPDNDQQASTFLAALRRYADAWCG